MNVAVFKFAMKMVSLNGLGDGYNLISEGVEDNNDADFKSAVLSERTKGEI